MGFFRRKTEHRDATPPVPLCSCGTPLDLVDMDYGFQLPDEVFALPQEDLGSRIRGLAKVFVLDGSRGFVRTVLPVRLDHGSVTFGIWLEIPSDQAQAAIRVWEEPGYASLAFSGSVANVLPPWNEALFGARRRPVQPLRTRFRWWTTVTLLCKACWPDRGHGRTSSLRFPVSGTRTSDHRHLDAMGRYASSAEAVRR